MNSPARQQQGILINLLLKARGALKTRRSSCSIPPALSFFQISLLISPLSTSHLTVCLSVCRSVLLPLSACLPACLLAYPPVCLPCVPVYLPPRLRLIVRQTPRSLLSDETYHEGDEERRRIERQRGRRHRVGGFRTRGAKAKCLSENPPLPLRQSSPPACLPAY